MVMMLVVGSVTADGTGAKLGQNLIFCLVRYRPYVLSVVLILLVLICYLILQTIWLTVKTGLQLVSYVSMLPQFLCFRGFWPHLCTVGGSGYACSIFSHSLLIKHASMHQNYLELSMVCV